MVRIKKKGIIQVKIGMIGGGMMGLVLAYRLGQKGHQVTVFEGNEQVGGLSTWYDFGDFVWDKYYHVILKSDASVLSLIEELHLTEKLHWEVTKTGFLWGGEILSMSNHWEFLKFPALSNWEKMRLGLGILYNQRVKDIKSLQGRTAADWFRSIFGKKVYHTIWEPLLESKYGVLKEKVPAIILWSTLNRYYSTRSKGDGKERMGHLRGGCLKVLFETLTQKIEEQGGSIQCLSPVESIEFAPSGKVSLHTQGKHRLFDHVISTIPRHFFPDMQGNTPLPTFLGVIRLALVVKERLTPYYVTNLIDRHYPFTGIVEVTNLGSKEEFGGKGLLMLPRYDIPSSEWFLRSDEEIRDAFLKPLMATWPNLQEKILSSVVHKEKYVQPLWIDTPPPLSLPIKHSAGNFWNAHNELIGYSNLNNNAIIEVANSVCQHILEKMS